ncbi:TadE/TadG family type IV pilus assembly protein [Phenylobacterium montanum]|uniref:Pilus assembly protein n=1 Tax=Phenylobacterium montanum TaxID=2823693 RepID=A0A975FX39_9CAUL|nr:TadE/TadG family type IV pilus assembly protein [Caulobacter sp. S6]QUD86751.1 pilus assembly protein [Caulobacter sp. S6]
MTRSPLSKVLQDRRGVSAVEFALIAPLMLSCYLGAGILCSALLAQRKANHVASAMGDLVSQAVTLAPADLADICTVANTVMQPYDTSSTSLKMRVSSIQEDGSGNVTVGWSYPCQGMAQLTKGSAYSGPAKAYLSPNQSIIVSEVTYAWASPLQTYNISWLPGSHTFTDTFFLQPRQSQAVNCASCS